ncbi:MAG: dTMP kinase [Thermoplasmata archaeon]|nr:dTMP kinase [Thermoplasmata archaeon]
MTARGRRPGLLVALEGIDGSGKSTLARALGVSLRRRGLRVALRREPADRALGRLAQEASVRDPWVGAIYFTLDRFLARPALERDLRRADVVITDRSHHSTLAYQGSSLGPAARRRLEELGPRATILPDRVVLLDLSASAALRRLGRRPRGRGPLERRRTLERVAARYRRLARRGGWLVLDARRTRSELVVELRDYLLRSLPTPRRSGRTARE